MNVFFLFLVMWVMLKRKKNYFKTFLACNS